MSSSSITIIKGASSSVEDSDPGRVTSFEEVKRCFSAGKFWPHLFRYNLARLVTYRLAVLPKPFLTALLLRLLCHGECYFEDRFGRREKIGAIQWLLLGRRLLQDSFRRATLLRSIRKDVELLSRHRIEETLGTPKLDLEASPVYLRTDLSFGVISGGSVGHIAGVLNQLESFAKSPIFLTTDPIPMVSPTVESHTVNLDASFWNFRELPSFHINEIIFKQALQALANRRISFVYQRYSLNNYVGMKLAKEFAIPFVLEYNGSEVWINRHWGQALRYEQLSSQIELLNLQGADVIVVVSDALRAELVSRGIDAKKILVNPNGVDSQRYSPEIDGSALRQQLQLTGKTVIGFIGTFGRWHGAEVLSAAFGELLKRNPAYRSNVRLLMIGDGMRMPDAREITAKSNVTEECLFTGLIPQEKGPQYLAAADILVAPHVPNPDGTPFFGSPTKLFEYMAMGRGIVASNLDQIGEVLQHGKTGWLVKPGDTASLQMGLQTLIDDEKLRAGLGQAARKEVIAKYTWQEHTRRIIEKLKECCDCD